jgi:histidine ammonia-lyase
MIGDDVTIPIDGENLTLDKVRAVARGIAKVDVSKAVMTQLAKVRKQLDRDIKRIVDEDKARPRKPSREEESDASKLQKKQKMMYGVTTGFGGLKTKTITEATELKRLQRNLVLSHACGVGIPFDRETTRAIMLLRANTLASGYCGISPAVITQLKEFINLDIRPEIPEQGSVGASGDLAPLAHLALGLIGEGRVKYKEGKAEESFDNLGKLKHKYPELNIKSKLTLKPKDGLALLNGLTVMTGIGVLAFLDSEILVKWSDIIGAATLESILGSSRAFDSIVFQPKVYGHHGARKSAQNVIAMITGSKLINRSEDVHDAYSVRCIPQVHGAVRDALAYVKTSLEGQLNSVDDDPIIFSDEAITNNLPLDCSQPPQGTTAEGWRSRRHFEQGNFHGEPIAFAMDMLAIAIAELGSISERRTQMLLDKNHNRGLPSCLVRNPNGVNSGYMIAQYTAAALVSENKVLCHPASVDSIPTSANTEDHVSMGTIAARKARKVIENVKNILAIELLCATEALSFRLGYQQTEKSQKPFITDDCGIKTKLLYEKIRRGDKAIPLLDGKDVIVYPRITSARELLREAPLEFVDD